MVGKWHLGAADDKLPTSRGFDDWLGIPFSNDNGCSWWLSGCGWPWQPRPLPLMDGAHVVEAPVNLANLTRRMSDRAVGAIAADAANGSAPFLVYVAFHHVHWPQFCATPVCPGARGDAFVAALDQLDAAVGAIVGAVDAAGVAERTLVLFTSDNGPDVQYQSFGGAAGALRGGKFDTWEGGQRVPLLARWPGTIAPGPTIAIASALDLVPTILALVAAAVDDDDTVRRAAAGSDVAPLDGVDLSATLLAGAASPRDAELATLNNASEAAATCVYYYQGQPEDDSARDGLWAMRCGSFKAHFTTATHYPSAARETQAKPLLFDLTTDWAEARPIANNSAAWNATVELFLAARAVHQAARNLSGIANQLALASREDLCVCADADSQAKYPGMPNCTLTPETWCPFGPDEKCEYTPNGTTPALHSMYDIFLN